MQPRHTAGRRHGHGLGGVHAGAAAESRSCRRVEQVAACKVSTHVNGCQELARMKLSIPALSRTRT